MKTAVMDEILRQKDAALKEAVRSSLAGDVRGAFEKLGDRVAEVKPDNLAGAAAARCLRLSGEEREHTGLMVPSHALRRSINGHIRDRLARDGAIHGPALEIERLVSHGYTTAEKPIAAHYAPGDVVGFQRDYRSLGVENGDEYRVVGVDHATGTVMLEGRSGEAIQWQPRRVGGRRGTVEVYRTETIELCAGDRIRWTRNSADGQRDCGAFASAQASGCSQRAEQSDLSPIVNTDLLQDTCLKCAIETCPLIRVEVRHLGRDVIGHEKPMGVTGNQIHAIDSQEVDESRCIRHDDDRAHAGHFGAQPSCAARARLRSASPSISSVLLRSRSRPREISSRR